MRCKNFILQYGLLGSNSDSGTEPMSIQKKIEEALNFLIKKTEPYRFDDGCPPIALVLGSGFSFLLEEVKVLVEIPYSEIPHAQSTSVIGHQGKLVVGLINDIPAVVLAGRLHLYEGHTPEQVTFLVRLLAAWGVNRFVLSNAAGAINAHYKVGDLVLIQDHINLTGLNPLVGSEPFLNERRFPCMTLAYCSSLTGISELVARQCQINTHRGVYAGLLGPTYETPAEIRMLRTLGADVVGMSTVHETIALRQRIGPRVCGWSLVTNMAAGMEKTGLSHQEVLENTKKNAGKLRDFVSRVVPALAFDSIL